MDRAYALHIANFVQYASTRELIKASVFLVTTRKSTEDQLAYKVIEAEINTRSDKQTLSPEVNRR
jgi:hypothetical protein